MLMKVLGIDPGTRHMGWGVLSRVGTKIEHIAHGVIDADEKTPLADRLVVLDAALREILETHRPDVGAVEGLFFAKDAQSAAKLGHARGVVLLRLAHDGIAIREYAPTLVKRTVVGKGAAEKKQVAMVVTAMLRLKSPPRADAADALAIALTHLAVANYEAAIAGAKR
ncbi:Crossover junction endodeoxyribonuclease RuvC [Minicystis rosea]|nr:Crossover junction endodeoxyribonuclease RuvC [Minicystis rosea]